MQFNQCDCVKLNQFYKHYKDKARAKPSDVMYAASQHGTLYCGLRLLRYSHYYFLRSVFTAPDVRGQGIASQLLAHIISQHPQPIYTLPTPAAVSLYQRLGFVDVNHEDIPAELLASYRRFRQTAKGPTVMVINN